MWKDCVSFTAVGCALTYLVDTAGTRTTSDRVNNNWYKDYCQLCFEEGLQYQNPAYNNANTTYHYLVERDGSEVFIIRNIRIVQGKDGMVRIYYRPYARPGEIPDMRISIENRSITLKGIGFYCTASMGNTPHLFIRNCERRVHFDGFSYIVRNLGHSACLDRDNNLRIR